MKYLKTFEKIDFNDIFSLNAKIKREELKDFCETYLAYLMDDCIKELKITDLWLLKTNKYVCYNIEIYFNKSVHWDQIKDHFLPFLQIVQKEYGFREDNIGRMCSIGWRIEDTLSTIPKQYTLKELLDDKIETNFTFELGSERKVIGNAVDRTISSIQGNIGSIKLEILEEVNFT